MKASYTSLLLGALVLVAAVHPQTAHAQPTDFCVTFAFTGWTIDATVDPATGMILGTADSFAGFTWLVSGARGTLSGQQRHLVLTLINPNMHDDPGCGDGTGQWADYGTYSGQVTGGAGGVYTYNPTLLNSCNTTLTAFTTLTLGACPAPSENAAPGPAGLYIGPPADDAAQADARTTSGGFALTSAPNPFEAGTLLSYTLPEAAAVRLAVYDALGREVAVLVDEEREAGTHAVTLDGASLPAGTYLCRMVAGAHAETKQVVLVR